MSWLATLELGTYTSPIGTTQTLDACKATKLLQVRGFRDALLYADVTQRGGSYRANLAHTGLLTAYLTLESIGTEALAPLRWMNQENQLVDISLTDAKKMLQAIVHHATRVFHIAAQKEAAIQAAETEQAVAEVKWLEPEMPGGVLPGNLFVTSGPCHQTFETEIAVDKVSVQ